MAGLSCAEQLIASNNKFEVTVYDTGRLRPGGRCSSRQVNDDAPAAKEGTKAARTLLSNYRYDHAAQVLTVPAANNEVYNEFSEQVKKWEKAGVLSCYPKDSVFNIRSKSTMEPVNSILYYGTEGMGSIPESIVKQSGGKFQLHQDVWVSPSNGVKYMKSNNQWKVQAGGKVLGMYDELVIAHNGKCADRLMSRTPAKQLHNLLRVNFAATVPAHGGKRMTLNSIYSLTFAVNKKDRNSALLLSKHLPDNFVCGYIHNHPALRFLTCQTRKYDTSDNNNDDNVEVWTVLSSSAFAKKHKAPQEFLPDDVVETVSMLLYSALEEAIIGNKNEKTKVADESSTPNKSALQSTVLEQRLQLWGAALPLNVYYCENGGGSSSPAGFLYDAEHSVGACGDWLLEASIAGAWTSGRLLAKHMLSSSSSDHQPKSHGLQDGSFRKSEAVAKACIGAVSA